LVGLFSREAAVQSSQYPPIKLTHYQCQFRHRPWLEAALGCPLAGAVTVD